jgi:ribosomal protein S18 acetylase RimI-like enzyme
MIDIRSASSADAGGMAELRWEFRAGRQPPVETHAAFIKRCAPWMRRELSTVNAWRAWVAVNGAVIVGQVWLHTIAKIPNPIAEAERHAYLSNLYVKPADRGGTGTRLLGAAIAAARADGVDRVVLWPSGRSVTLYLRHGFTHGGEVMELQMRQS